jgi:integrase
MVLHFVRCGRSIRTRRIYLSLSRKGPITPATVRKLSARAGELAKLPFPIHPHMLRLSAEAAAVPHEAGKRPDLEQCLTRL